MWQCFRIHDVKILWKIIQHWICIYRGISMKFQFLCQHAMFILEIQQSSGDVCSVWLFPLLDFYLLSATLNWVFFICLSWSSSGFLSYWISLFQQSVFAFWHLKKTIFLDVFSQNVGYFWQKWQESEEGIVT